MVLWNRCTKYWMILSNLLNGTTGLFKFELRDQCGIWNSCCASLQDERKYWFQTSNHFQNNRPSLIPNSHIYQQFITPVCQGYLPITGPSDENVFYHLFRFRKICGYLQQLIVSYLCLNQSKNYTNFQRRCIVKQEVRHFKHQEASF